MFQRLMSYFRLKVEKPGFSQRRGLLSATEFARLTEIERYRTDRTNIAFSLLTFAPRNRESCDETYAALAEILPKRLRLSDVVGWFDKHRIGVLCPDTPASGAWKIAEDVCRRIPPDLPAPICAVHSYPSSGHVADKSRRNGNGHPHIEDRAAQPMEALFAVAVPRWKRTLDVAGASLLLILSSPVFLLTAVLVKSTSSGPVFFVQKRTGLGGRPFDMYKFRSMVIGAEGLKSSLQVRNEQDGPAFKMKDDPRVTKVGRLLRVTAVDELPQLWNVLRGDMSLVGPRPLPCHESDGCARWQKRRLDVTPGLTCTWQVYGGPRVTFADWMRMDLRYARSRRLWRDLWLIVMTIPSIIRRDGVY